jgi:hypothetical protein
MKAGTYSKRRWLALAGLLLAMGFVSSCAGLKPYPNTLAKNVFIETSSEAGFLSKVRVEVDIYRVDKSCQGQYVGTVKLTEPKVKVGLPVDEWSYMAFNFASSSFLGNSSSSISLSTLLMARSGYTYNLKVSYADNIYNVEIFEKGPCGKKSREIDLRNLEDCNP